MKSCRKSAKKIRIMRNVAFVLAGFPAKIYLQGLQDNLVRLKRLSSKPYSKML
jgi:hypothetical protein